MGSFIKFLGTGGARFVVSQQLRHSGGIWFNLGGTQFHVDPGPGALVRALASKPKLDPRKLEAVILTHKHLDHANDVNIMAEAMSNGGFDKRGLLLAPTDCWEGDPVIREYLHPYVARRERLSPGSQHQVGPVIIRATASPLRHGAAETYGLLIEYQDLRIGYVSDTDYFDELPGLFAGCQVLIVNVVMYASDRPDILHMSLEEAALLLQEARPEAGILTHFGLMMLREKPWLEAARLTKKLGLKVIAASDGLNFPLNDWLRGDKDGI